MRWGPDWGAASNCSRPTVHCPGPWSCPLHVTPALAHDGGVCVSRLEYLLGPTESRFAFSVLILPDQGHLISSLLLVDYPDQVSSSFCPYALPHVTSSTNTERLPWLLLVYRGTKQIETNSGGVFLTITCSRLLPLLIGACASVSTVGACQSRPGCEWHDT